MSLDAKNVALLIAPRGTEDPEFTKPRAALEQAGVTVTVVGLEADDAQTVNNDLDPASTIKVDTTIDEVDPSDFDAVVVPGGTVGADKLRSSPAVVTFVGAFLKAGKPVAAICHAPWVLIETGALRGRTLTSYPTVQTDVRNAGATWVDQEVVVDSNLVTSRNPDDLPAFCSAILKQLAG
ncbi:type 1 glutamine amidotransferase domain-containing protein [Sphingomonas rosea]|uniref:Type 1 glutamine amidotransferase domain-containing protein n=1 Tax=Sphingomonas rosea TaxID=335605 RepID=A0ABP7UGJ0_9SPHN